MPKPVCHLDPGIRLDNGEPSHNLGDLIIQDAVRHHLADLVGGREVLAVPTHTELTPEGRRRLSAAKIKLVGGTNILSSRMGWLNRTNQWKVNMLDALALRGSVLMGCGWQNYQEAASFRAKLFYRIALHGQLPHSLRDQYSAGMLGQAGFTNVLNTNCVTMWNFADHDWSRYPVAKAERALIMATDYRKDPENDRRFIETVQRAYGSVYAWPQGPEDAPYLREVGFQGEFLSRSLASLDTFIRSTDSFDYLGTRLHGGIRCMQNYRRALIIEVDNRATEIARDTHLPTVARDDFDRMEAWIAGEPAPKLQLQTTAVQRWKSEVREAIARS
jgi:hypothetical protein